MDYESDEEIEESDQDEEEPLTNGNKCNEERKIWGGKDT